MKNIIIFFTFFIGLFAHGQIFDPVHWNTKVEKINDNEFELIATAIIDGNWHMYSQSVPEDGPIPTTFTFEGSKDYLKKGNTKENKGHEVDDPVFNMHIKYFNHQAVFKQRIRIKNHQPFKVNAEVEFMLCNDKQCLPPKEVELVFNIPKSKRISK